MRLHLFVLLIIGTYLHAGVPGNYLQIGYNSKRTLLLTESHRFKMTLKVQDPTHPEGKNEIIEKGNWSCSGGVIILDPDGAEKYGEDVWYAKLFFREENGIRRLICAVDGAWAFDKYGFEECLE